MADLMKLADSMARALVDATTPEGVQAYVKARQALKDALAAAHGVPGTGSASGYSTAQFSNLGNQAHGYGVRGLAMADGSPLLDYLNVGDDPPNTDEWTKGFHEARRRLYRILAPQLTAGVLGTSKDQQEKKHG